MISPQNRLEEFSAEVRLELLIDGRTISLAKTGPGYAVLSKREEIPAGDAVLLMHIDGREHRWEIVLDNAVLPFDEEFSYRVKKYPEPQILFPY